MADTPDTTVPDLEVIAQEAKTPETPEPREPQADVVNETVEAQVAQPREADRTEVPVHETSVTLDTVITDTSDPNAVIVPPEGRGEPRLPIHRAVNPTVEQVFAEKASGDHASNEDREAARQTGTTITTARGEDDSSVSMRWPSPTRLCCAEMRSRITSSSLRAPRPPTPWPIWPSARSASSAAMRPSALLGPPGWPMPPTPGVGACGLACAASWPARLPMLASSVRRSSRACTYSW